MRIRLKSIYLLQDKMSFSISVVPQADELSKVILTAEAVSEGKETDADIASYVEFTVRQGRYYRLAAEILGLITNKSNNAKLTPLGEELVALDEENRLRKIRSILRTNDLFSGVLAFINDEDGRTRDSISHYLHLMVVGAPATIERRVSTVISWLKETGLVKVDFSEIADGSIENVYLLNDEILEEDDSVEEQVNSSESIYPANYNNEELEIKEDHLQVVALMRKQTQNKILIPEFQRNQVWKQQQKSRFIESLILNIPVPPFYVSQDLDGNSIIIDGLQRTTSITEFLNNEYKLVGLEALPKLNGYKFDELEELLKARIEDRNLLLYTLKPSVPMSIVYDIFNRINSNGTSLNRQEIRNCIFIGKSTRLLKELASSDEFKTAINYGIPSTRMKDREGVLRILAFIIFQFDSDYKGDMDDFLGRVMRRLNVFTDQDIQGLRDEFMRIMRFTFEFFGDRNFRLITNSTKGRINIAVMETICFFFHKNDDEFLIANKEQIINNYQTLLSDVEYIDAVKSSTSSDKKVKSRFNKAFEILSTI